MSGIAQVLLPVITQTCHEGDVLLDFHFILNESISLILVERDIRGASGCLKQHRIVSGKSRKISEGKDTSEICAIRVVKRFRKKSADKAENVLAANKDDDVLNLETS
jgi:hypothetical protein